MTTTKEALFIVLFLASFLVVFAQSNSTDLDTTSSGYKNLETKIFYNTGTEENTSNGITVFKVNGKIVDKRTYNKYHSTWKNMETCKPCILMTYDENDKLVSKGVKYQDCPVGFWIEYFSNGKIKVIGHFKEFVNGRWGGAADDPGFCKKHGTWTYYNENGDKLYVEYWENGEMIKRL